MQESERKNIFLKRSLAELISEPVEDRKRIEAQVLADVIAMPHLLPDARRILSESDFCEEPFRGLWKAILARADRGLGTDLVACSALTDRITVRDIAGVNPHGAQTDVIECFYLLKETSKRSRIFQGAVSLLQAVHLGPVPESVVEEAFEEIKRNAARADWKESLFDPLQTFPDPEPVITIGGAPVATKGNLTILAGAPKTCKSTFQSALIATLLGGSPLPQIEAREGQKVLLCDTEQAPLHLLRQVERSFRLARLQPSRRDDFQILSLREEGPQERLEIIRSAVEDLRPDVLFLDGIGDLVSDSNDLAQSEKLVSELLAMCSEYQLVIVGILHTNPASTKERGHLGSVVQRKAETVLLLEREGMDTHVKVTCKLARNKPCPETWLELDEHGDPMPSVVSRGPQTSLDWLVHDMVPNRLYDPDELYELLAKNGYGKNAAKQAIYRARQNQLVTIEEGKYTLVLRPNQNLINYESAS